MVRRDDIIVKDRLVVRRDDIIVKVEVNTVMRGTVHPVCMAELTAAASDVLQADLELPVTSLADTYGGKLAAAMDRQHPRDLFALLRLFANEGITPAIRRAFVVYLASHHRPVHELLFPRERDISDVPEVSQLPSVQWKLFNLEKLQVANGAKFMEQRDRLFELFDALPRRTD